MSYMPDVDPSNKILAVILWVYTLVVGAITNTIQIPTHELTNISILDIILDIISKLTPVISTIFLYIINKKAIDTFFKSKFRKRKP
jgi:hypothetical protein